MWEKECPLGCLLLFHAVLLDCTSKGLGRSVYCVVSASSQSLGMAITNGETMTCIEVATLHAMVPAGETERRRERLVLLAHALQSGAPPDALWLALGACR